MIRNGEDPINPITRVNGQQLESVKHVKFKQFKYLGVVISQDGSKLEVRPRIANTLV